MNDDPHQTTQPAPASPILQTPYWRRSRQLTVQLLVVWFLVTFIPIFFARELSGITLFGWPFPFYMAAQGSILIYLLIIGLYAWRMRQLEKNYQHEHSDVE